MQLKPEELTEGRYLLLDTLGHMDIVPFVRTYLKKRTPSSVFYTASNLLSLALILFYSWWYYGSENFTAGDGLTHLSYGFAIAFGLVPLHEYIHALAYRSVGARQTSYDANLRKFYFMAVADKFVADKREFQIVALAPFVVISTTLLILLPFVSQLWVFTVLGVLLTHTAFCSGDFGLLSYFDYHRDKTILTYDDKENKVSYFYEQIR